jgi:hypothetical protein
VGLAIGAVSGVRASSEWSAAQTGCSHGQCVDAASWSSWSDARSSAWVSSVAFAVGGVAAVGGAVLWLTAPSSGATVQVGAFPGRLELSASF